MSLKMRELKKEQIEFFKSQKKSIRKDDIESRVYLDNSIKILESELETNQPFKETIYVDQKIIDRLITLIPDERECRILACFFSNKDPLSVGKLSDGLDIDRGVIYRTCDKFCDQGVLTRTAHGITRYHLTNPDKPFIHMVERHQKDIEQLESFNAKGN